MGPDKTSTSAQINDQLQLFQETVLAIGTILDLNSLLRQLVARITADVPCKQCVLLIADDENTALRSGMTSGMPDDPQTRSHLDSVSLSLFNAETTPIVSDWLSGTPLVLTADNTAGQRPLNWLTGLFPDSTAYSQPMIDRNRLVGVILIENQSPLSTGLARLQTISLAAAVAVQNARIYSKTVHQAEVHLRELTILRQIDRELNDTIEPQHVFQMTLDWALRFTNAQAASIGLYDQDTDDFRILATYGYDIQQDQVAMIRLQRGGIGQRIARSGHAEIIPDVSLDKDFIRGASLTQSQMSVPVMREDRVIAVISVESKKLNGFTDDHLAFVEKLAARAGVAIDNARLFDATEREREKLSHILNNTADVVIVFGLDERIILINPAALSALRLYTGENYVGRRFQEVFEHTAFTEAYQRARASAEPVIDEVPMPNGRIFHMNLTRHENVGWIIVMHDITLFKEMDQLKSELIATVSHDLKQPLAVMNGYIELLMMHRKLDEVGLNFLDMVRKSIQNMRQLIDDLLDLAKIESGIRLDLKPVDVQELVGECIDSLKPVISAKALQMTLDFPPDLPHMLADRARLQQILLNLISNAVKYTQPEGWIRVVGERRDKMVRVVVQDNGMGISPEDQVHIFERFYRVRRPETDSIEGTGLGLAIVKSLVEAHNGKIGLESRLGEGTTFFVTIPTAEHSEEVVIPTEA